MPRVHDSREGPMKIRCYQGERDVNVGDQVDLDHQGKWEVVGFGTRRMYGPSDIGGTPVVVCKPLEEVISALRQYQNQDGTKNNSSETNATTQMDADRQHSTVTPSTP